MGWGRLCYLRHYDALYTKINMWLNPTALDYWSRDMRNSDFLEKGLGIVSSLVLCMIFQEKCFSYYILLTDQISLSDYLYFLKYWAMSVLRLFCFPGCDVINFEINLIFLIKPFFYVTIKSRQRFTYLENEKSFWDQIRSTFHHFERAFSSQQFSQT